MTEGTGKEASGSRLRRRRQDRHRAEGASDGGGYGGGRYVGSFIGFLPAEDPQVLVCVILDEPQRVSTAARRGADLHEARAVRRRAPQDPARVDVPDRAAKTAAKAPAKAGVGPVSDQGARD